MTKPDGSIFIVYYNLGLGGLQKKIVDIINYLGVRKPETRIFLLLRRKKEDFDIGWQISNPNSKVFFYNDWIRVRIPFFFPVFVFWKVLVLKPKVILAFSDIPSLSSIWAKLLLFWRDIKVIVSERAYTSWYISSETFGQFRNYLVKLFYPFSDQIVCLTKASKDDLLRNYCFSEEKITLIPNWTSLAKEKPLRIKKKYDFIYTGRLAKAKNVIFLLKALLKMKGYKNIKLCLLGSGTEKNRILNFIEKNNLEENVDLLDAQYDVRPYLCQSKIFVLTPQYKAEGFPTSVLEAMAMKIPVLCRRFAGLEDVIVDKKNGYVFGSMDEFVRKAILLLENPAHHKMVVKNAKEYVEKYHSLSNIEYYLQLVNI